MTIRLQPADSEAVRTGETPPPNMVLSIGED